MKTILTAALVAAAIVPAPLAAKPINAAEVTQRDRCAVTDATGAHRATTCEVIIVEKRDRDGHYRFFNYSDHAVLPDDMVRPDRAIINQIDMGPECKGSETITPSGEYRSNIRCVF